MEGAQPSVFVNSSRAGILRVKQGDYAYLMESSMLEYYIERDCELMQIGGLLDSKGYGIGLPKHSPYREPISSAILMLQEKTVRRPFLPNPHPASGENGRRWEVEVLTELKDKWWKQKRGGGQCKGEDSNKVLLNKDCLFVASFPPFFVLPPSSLWLPSITFCCRSPCNPTQVEG